MKKRKKGLQTKKKNIIQKKKKVVEQPTKSSCSCIQKNVNKVDANYKYLRNSNASPFVKFLSSINHYLNNNDANHLQI